MTAELLVSQSVRCAHCGEDVPPVRRTGEPAFCCGGCETVYGILHAEGLTGYYDLAANDARPVRSTERAYAELDAASFHERNVTALPSGRLAADLYLEGVRCAGCVWLVEKLPRLLPGVVEARLELGRGLARLRWDPRQVTLSAIARALDSLGYPVHPFRGASRRERQRGEDRAHLVRIAVAGFLAGNVMLLAFALYSGASGAFSQLFRWGALLLTIPAVLGPGRVFLKGALASIRTRTPHMDLPVGLAIAVGLGWGAWNTIRGAGEIYFDTVAVLIFLLLVGRWLQHRQQRVAADAAELTASLAPSWARRVHGEVTETVPLEALASDDVVEVRGGEVVPSDGLVLSGESRVDASLLTGESRPARVGPGDEVFAGTLNAGSALRVRVTRTGEETRVGRLMRQVEEHARRKAPVVQLADRLAGRFVVAVVTLAVLTLGLWLWLDPAHAVDHAVALLVVTCPCALGLATPLAISAALGRAARRGVLIKGGDVLQRLATPGRIWLDKTGTLTEGRTALVEWRGDDAVRPLVLGLEAHSAHPVAEGFRRAWGEEAPAADEVVALGAGLRGRVAGREVVAGSPACLRELEISAPDWASEALQACLARALTPVLVAVDGEVRGVAGFGDPVREEAREVLAALRARGWTVGVLSGDHAQVVEAVARDLGIADGARRGGLLPEDKLAQVEADLRAGPVVMVGDGVNDAAALSAATVGVGVHGGSEAALGAADVFLARPGLAPLAELLDLARAALRRIQLNLAISLTYNVIAASLAIAGVITPLLAAVLMPISSLTVIANSYGRREEAPWR